VSWLVEFNGKELNIDPTDFTGLELSLIKQRTGLNFGAIVEGLRGLDGDAIRALFWAAERRTDPEIKFSDYDGPSLRFFVLHLDGLIKAMDELGKAMTPETDGSPSSPSDSVTPEPTMTL
jgi:hypothetical protein